MRSLRLKLSLAFAVAVGINILLLFFIHTLQHQALTDKIRENQQNAISWLNSLYEKSQDLPDNWGAYFKNFNLKYVDDPGLRDKVLNRAEIIERYDTKLGKVEVLRLESEYFLKMRQNTAVVVLQNTLRDKSAWLLLLCFAGVLVVLGVLFFSVTKSLAPLKVLREDIAKFATGNFDESCKIFTMQCRDEIGQVAEEFYRAACKIKSLVESRQLFLRAIMHELKTPIGKGRILSESLDDELMKSRMVKIFERLNELINEFAKVEKLASGSYLLNLRESCVGEVFAAVQSAMMLEHFDEKIDVKFACDTAAPLAHKVDFDLFVLAVKNLLDNALKYSSNGCAAVEFGADYVRVKNCGAPLRMEFARYKEPFVREKSGKQNGMGLGLYIIDKICELHGFALAYDYKDGRHEICVEMAVKAGEDSGAGEDADGLDERESGGENERENRENVA